MRHLLQPRVLNLALGAAALSAIASYPRLSLWSNRPDSLIFSETAIFFCSTVLWGFVFAWHEPYTSRPVFMWKFEPKLIIGVTVAALGLAAIYHFWLDPLMKSKLPEDYPTDAKHWLATLPFVLCFNLL